jgi:hypothetical protein
MLYTGVAVEQIVSVHCALFGSVRAGRTTGNSDAENLPERKLALISQ